MIYTLIFRRYAPFKTFGGGFEGDCRTSASVSLMVSARTIGIVTFAPGNVGTITASSSGTSFKGAGARVERLLGTHISKVTSSVAVATRTIECLRFTAQTSGSNPMVPLAPDIDTFIDLSVVFRSHAIELQGTVRGDDFPNAEVFVLDGTGFPSLLFDFKTTGGQNTGPVLRLAAAHDKQEIGSFNVRIATRGRGEFQKTCDSPS